jgi:hypothetical protein
MDLALIPLALRNVREVTATAHTLASSSSSSSDTDDIVTIIHRFLRRSDIEYTIGIITLLIRSMKGSDVVSAGMKGVSDAMRVLERDVALLYGTLADREMTLWGFRGLMYNRKLRTQYEAAKLSYECFQHRTRLLMNLVSAHPSLLSLAVSHAPPASGEAQDGDTENLGQMIDIASDPREQNCAVSL